MVSHRNPTLFCTVFGIGAFLIAIAYFFKQGLTFPLLVRALAVGFFAGSMAFSILSLQNRASESKKENASLSINLVLISVLVGGAVSAPYFLAGSMGKAAEILIIVAGLASLLVGYYMEKNLQK